MCIVRAWVHGVFLFFSMGDDGKLSWIHSNLLEMFRVALCG